MGQVVPFSDVENYVQSLQKPQGKVRSILDTNVLASLTYEVKPNHDAVVDLILHLENMSVDFFATVNTKQEFIDFHRRLLLTENLLDVVDPHSKAKIPQEAKQEIQKAHASIMSRHKTHGSDPIFNDTQIKDIKREFSAGSHSGQLGGLKFCETYLKPQLLDIEQALEDRGIVYLSPNDASQVGYFTAAPLRWSDAIGVTCLTGVSMTDAMILNCLRSSVCQFAVSTDFDLGFAVLADSSLNKDVLMPDKDYKEFRHYHFPST
jgi:predicted nucleic acid-binding protein